MRVTAWKISMAGAALACAAAGSMQAIGQASGQVRAQDGYFLSRTNTIANIDQRDLEALAVRLFARPDVKAACDGAKIAWARVTDHLMPADQMARFEDAMSDYCFKSVLVAANIDANHPRALRVYSPAARWFGTQVPASKWGGDNPDNAYRIIPIAAGARYEIRGQRQPHPSTYVTFQLVGNSSTSETLGSLEQRDMKVAADGSYLLTLDSTPSAGRTNHLQTVPGTYYLFIRDSMGDWATQAPDALRVKRLDPPARGPLSEDELAVTAIRNIRADVYYAYFSGRLFFNSPQSMSTPQGAGSVGGLVSQMGSLGHFTLAPDEAVVITASPGNAAYRNVVLHDLWLRSLDYRDHQTSLNNGQMLPDADGRFTYVIAGSDPGVHNWLDTTGLGDVLVLHRWQGFPQGVNSSPPAIQTRIVKLSDLKSALPAGVRMVSPQQRRAQLEARRSAYDRRFAER